jgi:hypothetical protein
MSECDQVKINNPDTYCEQVEEGRTTNERIAKWSILIPLSVISQVTPTTIGTDLSTVLPYFVLFWIYCNK